LSTHFDGISPGLLSLGTTVAFPLSPGTGHAPDFQGEGDRENGQENGGHG
jgi:hypothetical protein